MPWTFEDAAPMIGSITEGNCWTGTHMLYSNIALNRIMRLNVETGLVDVFAEDTEGTNGLNYDADGILYGCASTGRKIVRFDDDGNFETVVDRIDGLRLNSPNDLAITPSSAIYFSDRVGDSNPDVGITYSAIISAEQDEDGNWVCTRRTFDTTQPNGPDLLCRLQDVVRRTKRFPRQREPRPKGLPGKRRRLPGRMQNTARLRPAPRHRRDDSGLRRQHRRMHWLGSIGTRRQRHPFRPRRHDHRTAPGQCATPN